MIRAKLINSSATLNSFFELSSLSYVPGENVTLNLRIFDLQQNLRYIPPVAATMTLTFDNKDGTTLTKTATVLDSDDRSLWTVALSQAETAALGGSNIQVILDINGDASAINKTVLANSLSKINLSGDC